MFSSINALRSMTFGVVRGIDAEMSVRQRRIATGKIEGNASAEAQAAEFRQRAAQLKEIASQADTARLTLQSANKAVTSIRSLLEKAQTIGTSALAVTTTMTYASVTGTKAGLVSSGTHGIGNGKTLTFSDGTTTATITTTAGQTFQNVVDAINNTANLKLRASFTSDGRFMVEATGANGITIGGTANSGDLDKFGLTAGTTAAAVNPTNAARTALATQFDTILSQIDAAARAAGAGSANLLRLETLSVKLGADDADKFTIQGFDGSAGALGVSRSLNQFQTDADIQAALDDLTAAFSTVDAQKLSLESRDGMIGVRQDYSREIAGMLDAAAEENTAADVEEESAALLELQTRRDLALSAYSMAGNRERSAMRILGFA